MAGWIGSALGIGMGQNLGHVPLSFVAAAGVVVLVPMYIAVVKRRPRELALIAAVGTFALIVYWLVPAERRPIALTPAERGRQIYISGAASLPLAVRAAEQPGCADVGPRRGSAGTPRTEATAHRQSPSGPRSIPRSACADPRSGLRPTSSAPLR